ncbi:TerB family tellurite resistance protein [Aquimarina rhabdastrellae]
MVKWAGAVLGFIFFRYPGALLGFILGSLFDGASSNKSSSINSAFKTRKEVSPGDFELNLLSLASIVIKADGHVNQTELIYVRQYFVSSYGKDHANAIFKTFNEVIKKREVSAQRICFYLSQRTRYPSRLQIIHFLFGIANADGVVSEAEAREIELMSGFLRIGRHDFESIKAMFFKSADNAYKILEIDKSASNAEVKKAFRNMAKKYHPDKVQHLGDAYVKGAEEKFRTVQKAYEQIQKERGM